MNITMIVATDTKSGIGFKNTIPWLGKVPGDMKRFKALTTGHPVIMGKNTYLSLNKPLANRTNIVLTKNKGFWGKDIVIVHSLSDALEEAEISPGNEQIFIIGGEQVYREALPFASKILLTKVIGEFETDTSFPEIFMDEWRIESTEVVNTNESDQYSSLFITYTRK